MRQLKITERITGRETESFKTYLKDISKIEMFESAEAEQECAIRAFDGDEDAVEELVRRNLRFVVSVAKQYQKHGVSLEDLVNEGNCGLLEAARRFDPTAGNKFISYAVWYVRKDIMAYLSKSTRTIKLPINKVNSMIDFNNKVNSIRQRLGRDVELQDLLGNVEGYSDNSIEDMLNIQNHSVSSMDVPMGGDSENSTLHDVLESDEFKTTDHLVMEENMAKTLDMIMGGLKPKAKTILMMYYGVGYPNPMNLQEVGEEIGMTREGVRQIKEKSLRQVRVRARKLGINISMF